MKFLIIFAIICILDSSWAEFPYEMFQKVKDSCLKEHQPTLTNLNENKITEEQILRKCFYEKIGYVKDGIVQKDVLMEQFKNTYLEIKVKHMIRLCDHIVPNNPDNLDRLDDCYDHTSGDYFLSNWKRICDECKETTQLSTDEYATLQYLPVKNITKSMKLYAKCALERHGFLKNNNLQEEAILEVAEDFKDSKHLKVLIEQCKEIREDNEDDTPFKLYKCLEEIEDKYVQSTEDEYKMVQKACLKEKQLTPNDVFSEQKPSTPTPALKLFANCVFEKMHYIEDGNLQLPIIYQKAERSKFFNNYLLNISRCVNNTKNDNNYSDRDMVAYNFAICLDLFSGEHFLRDWENAGSECQSEENPNRGDIMKLQTENPTLTMKYYAACVFKKLNFLKDNIFQYNVISKLLDDYRDAEYLKIFLNTCKQIKENEHGDTAVKLFQCMEKIIETNGKN